MCRKVLYSFCVGSFLLAAPAHAVTKKALKIEDVRAKLLQRKVEIEKEAKTKAELRSILSSGRHHSSELGMLQENHKATANPGRLFRLIGKDGDALELNDDGKLVVSKDGSQNWAQHDDLIRHGIDGTEAFDKLVKTRLLEVAKMKGEISDGKLVNDAYIKLSRQNDSVRKLSLALVALPDVKLLGRHQAETSGSNSSDVILDGSLMVREGRLLDRQTGKHATLEQLDERGAGTPEGLQLWMNRVLLEQSGVKGKANNPVAVEKARAALNERIEDIGFMKSVAANPSGHQNLSLAWTVHASNQEKKNKGFEYLTLATLGDEVIKFGGSNLSVGRVTANGQIQWKGGATFQELQRFGIGTRETFDAAVDKLMQQVHDEMP